MTTARSARTSTTLVILGAVAVWTALIVGGAARGIIRPDPFARRVAASLSDPRVSGYVAARITDAIVAQRPNLVSVRSILQPAVNGVVASAPFRAVVRTSARTAHRSLFESATKNVVLSLPAVLTPDPALRGFVHGLWTAFFLPIKPLALIAGTAGIVLSAAGGTMLEAVDPLTRFKALWRWLTVPLKPHVQVGRAMLVLAAGTFAIVSPGRAATGIIAIIGLLLVYIGLREVFRVVLARSGGATVGTAVRAAPPQVGRA